MISPFHFRCPFLALALLAAGMSQTRAQWLTQSFALKAGWNAVYLHVDASHITLDSLIGADVTNQVQEIWMWSPSPSAAQFVSSPQSPSQPANWLNWARGGSPSASLTKLQGNVACLVRATADYTWNLKGKAVVPSYQWTSSGLNFIGFPTLLGAAAPSFDTFFSPAPQLKVGADIFAYKGGPITSNPVQVLDLTATKAVRGQAFWVRTKDFNRYFGPFEAVFAGPTGLSFGDSVGQMSFRLRNVTDQPLTVTLNRVASEAAPAGQPAVKDQAPLLVRGSLNTTNLVFDYRALGAAPMQWILPKAGDIGSDIEVVMGVNRQLLTGDPGSVYANVLRFTDSLKYTQVDVPVTATVGSTTGLWVGDATVSAVSQYLEPYAKVTDLPAMTNLLARLGLSEGTNGYHFSWDSTSQRVLVFGGPDKKTGSYLMDGTVKTDYGTVAQPYPLRLIVHNDGQTARLLPKVYYGVGTAQQPVLATKESLLDKSQLASARRISAVHLPLPTSTNTLDFKGAMKPGSSLATTVATAYDDQASNPFLHTYHPDHDNLDASFRAGQARGVESYDLRRQITLNFTAPATDFDSLTKGTANLNGEYSEVLTFLGLNTAQRQYNVRGTFVLNRISDIATLTTQ